MVLVIAAPAVALKYSDEPPNWAGCPGSSVVYWEFLDDGCSPTSDEADPAYYYDPCVPEPVFGGRNYNTPNPGWGRPAYEIPLVTEAWEWADGAFTVLSEDSFNQPVPPRGEGENKKKYLRQYFQVVHTMPPKPAEKSFIGVGLGLTDLSLVVGGGAWTGCPLGYEGTVPNEGGVIGYLEDEDPTPTIGPTAITDAEGWYKSIWIADFDEDGTLLTPYPHVTVWYEDGLDLATHTSCMVGMDLDYDEDDGGGGFDIEEIVIDFIWFNEADGSDIPQAPCFRPGKQPPVIIDVNDIPIYEPQDIDGPVPMGPTDGQIQVSLKWRPSEINDGEPNYIDFTCTVMVDPDPNQENAGSADFSFTKPVPPDPNGNVYLTFNQTNWNQYQNVHVAATEDLLKEGDEASQVTFIITIDIDDPNFGGPGSDPVETHMNLKVVDNDIPHISVSPYLEFMNVLTEDSPGVPRCVDVILSHKPTSDVDVLVHRESEYDILLESMSVMDPNLFTWADPNKLIFTPGNYNTPQEICLEAIDDNKLAEAGSERIRGVIIFDGFSDDIRYKSSEEGGELEATEINFNVQDNECGAWGYDHADTNEDCVVDLSEIAKLYDQWTFCTDPYDGEGSWVDCDAAWNLVPPE